MSRLLLITACGASAGIHAALVPGHLAESRTLGLAFMAAVVLLAAAAVALTLRPSPGVALAAGTLFAGLIFAYVATRVSEPVDAVGLGTKAIETVGLVLALAAARAEGPARRGVRLAPLALALVVGTLAATVTPAGAHEHAPGTTPHGH
jgi:hypothetical protein